MKEKNQNKTTTSRYHYYGCISLVSLLLFILHFTFNGLLKTGEPNVASTFIVNLLEEINWLQSILFALQKKYVKKN